MRKRLLIAAGMAGVGLLVTAGCSSSEPSAGELEQARQEGEDRARAEASREAEVLRLQEEVAELEAQGNKARAKAKKAEAEAKAAEAEARDQANSNSGGSGSGGALSGPQTECVDYVFAGATTSCPFAINVAGEYNSNPGASKIQAYSPATGLSYSLSCSPYSGGGTVCVTNTGASVYIG